MILCFLVSLTDRRGRLPTIRSVSQGDQHGIVDRLLIMRTIVVVVVARKLCTRVHHDDDDDGNVPPPHPRPQQRRYICVSGLFCPRMHASAMHIRVIGVTSIAVATRWRVLSSVRALFVDSDPSDAAIDVDARSKLPDCESLVFKLRN